MEIFSNIQPKLGKVNVQLCCTTENSFLHHGLISISRLLPCQLQHKQYLQISKNVFPSYSSVRIRYHRAAGISGAFIITSIRHSQRLLSTVFLHLNIKPTTGRKDQAASVLPGFTFVLLNNINKKKVWHSWKSLMKLPAVCPQKFLHWISPTWRALHKTAAASELKFWFFCFFLTLLRKYPASWYSIHFCSSPMWDK